MHMPVPPEAVALVKQSEGCKLKAYLCPAGVPTIGYGHTKGVKLGQTITQATAETFLAQDLMDAAAQVDELVTIPINAKQRGALASLVFNIGVGNFRSSTLRKRLNSGDIEAAAGEFGKWVKATVDGRKVTLPGLVARRAAEAKLFLADTFVDTAVPQAVEPPAAMKPLAKSITVQTGGIGLGAAGVVAAIDQARDVSDAAKSLLGSLPSGSAGYIIAGILALAVAVMLYRRWHDSRQVV